MHDWNQLSALGHRWAYCQCGHILTIGKWTPETGVFWKQHPEEAFIRHLCDLVESDPSVFLEEEDR